MMSPHKADRKKARQDQARQREGNEKGKGKEGKSLPVTQVSRVQGWSINLGLYFTFESAAELTQMSAEDLHSPQVCTWVDLPRCLILLN